MGRKQKLISISCFARIRAWALAGCDCLARIMLAAVFLLLCVRFPQPPPPSLTPLNELSCKSHPGEGKRIGTKRIGAKAREYCCPFIQLCDWPQLSAFLLCLYWNASTFFWSSRSEALVCRFQFLRAYSCGLGCAFAHLSGSHTCVCQEKQEQCVSPPPPFRHPCALTKKHLRANLFPWQVSFTDSLFKSFRIKWGWDFLALATGMLFYPPPLQLRTTRGEI